MKFPSVAGLLLRADWRARVFRVTVALSAIALATVVLTPAAAPSISKSGEETGSHAENDAGQFLSAIERPDIPITSGVSNDQAFATRQSIGTGSHGPGLDRRSDAGSNEDPDLAE